MSDWTLYTLKGGSVCRCVLLCCASNDHKKSAVYGCVGVGEGVGEEGCVCHREDG